MMTKIIIGGPPGRGIRMSLLGRGIRVSEKWGVKTFLGMRESEIVRMSHSAYKFSKIIDRYLQFYHEGYPLEGIHVHHDRTIFVICA